MIVLLFWIFYGILFYIYIGYGFVLWLISRFLPKSSQAILTDEQLPNIVHIVPAYNEEETIELKLQNIREIDYPPEKVRHVIIADGSTDGTVDMVRKCPEVQLMYSSERKGKLAAINRALAHIEEDIVVFSDANSMISKGAFRKMMAHMTDGKVGAVAGEKVVKMDGVSDAASGGEGLYWKYESWLKYLESRVHSTIGAAGELFAIRKTLYKSPPSNALTEDFVIVMSIAKQGYRIAYESEARAWEKGSANIKEEMKRKVRISAGGLQSVGILLDLLNPLKYGLLTWQYISHRALRWTLAPISLVGLLMTNGILISVDQGFYPLFFGLQLSFYALALAGYLLQSKRLRWSFFFVPFYFLFMHVCVVLGWWKLFFGKLSVNWERAERKIS